MDFVEFVNRAPEPHVVLHEVLEAVLGENNHLSDLAVEIGVTAAACIAEIISKTNRIRPHLNQKVMESVVNSRNMTRLRSLASSMIACAMEPWGRSTGGNGLYAYWQGNGQVDEYLNALAIYGEMLKPTDDYLTYLFMHPGSVVPARDIYSVDEDVVNLLERYAEYYRISNSVNGKILAHAQVVQEATIYAAVAVAGGLINDVRVLAVEASNVLDVGVAELRQLYNLPWLLASEYDSHVASQLLCSTITITNNILQGRLHQHACVGEQMAMLLMYGEAYKFVGDRTDLEDHEKAEAIAEIGLLLDKSSQWYDSDNFHFSSSLRRLSEITPVVPDAWLIGPYPPRIIKPADWFKPFVKGIYAYPYF
jgi:hypothetical protein